MCFSAQADVVGGLVVTAVGLDVVRQVRRPAEWALASLPVLLGSHLLVEAVVWWGLTDRIAWSAGRAAMWVYLAFALGVLPVLVPLAVRAVETDPGRRRVLTALMAAGAGLAVVYLARLLRGPVDVRIGGHYLAYRIGMVHGGFVAAVYVVVACGPLLCSSHRRVVGFGVANLGAVIALAWLQRSALTSLWCAWAGVASMAVATHLRREHQRRWSGDELEVDSQRRVYPGGAPVTAEQPRTVTGSSERDEPVVGGAARYRFVHQEVEEREVLGGIEGQQRLGESRSDEITGQRAGDAMGRG